MVKSELDGDMDQAVAATVAEDNADSQKPKRHASTRPTIGLLRFMYRIWENSGFLDGVFDAARREDVNLICFNDQRLEAAFEQRDWIYDLAGPETLDGLIIGGTIGFSVSAEVFNRYCQRFANLPRVSAAIQLPGVPWITVDGYTGMYQAVDHLITVHGHSRIAFIKGPGETLDAAERFQAYADAMAAHRLPLEPALLAQGDYSRESGQGAMRQLLALQAQFGAVVAANDSMALGALDVLQAQGIDVPNAVALVGFDDFVEARLAAVPFTTVRQNIYQEGYQAVLTLLHRLRGESVPARSLVPTALVVRQSCGCAPQSSRWLAAAASPATAEAGVELDWQVPERQASLAVLQAALETPIRPWAVNYAPEPVWGAALGRVWDGFLADLRAEAGSTHFPVALEAALRQSRERSQPLENWQHVLEALAALIVPRLVRPDLLRRASVLLQQGQALTGEARLRWQAHREAAMQQAELQLQELETQLTGLTEPAELASVLNQHLPRLGIRRCYLALYGDRAGLLAEAWSTEPDWQRHGDLAELFVTCEPEQGVRLVHGPGFPTRQLAPEGLLPQGRYTLVVQPLAFNDRQLGLAGYEAGASDPAVYARLTIQLGHALYRMYLIRRQQATQQGLQERAAELALANHELEAFSYSVSHDLRSPLRTINGYSQVLVEDYERHLPPEARRLLSRIQAASDHMAKLIDDLLRLSRVLRSEMSLVKVDLSWLVTQIASELEAASPERRVELVVAPGVTAMADPNLIRIALENLLGNAWKFTARNPAGRVEFGVEAQAGETIFFVRDNGAGFDMAYADKLFGAFQRLHTTDEFEGTGIGLTIVQRIIRRHAGQIWAEGAPGQGAKFSFTLRQHSFQMRGF